MAATSLSWLVAQPKVASVIVGASRPEQIIENSKLISLTKVRNMLTKPHYRTETELFVKPKIL